MFADIRLRVRAEYCHHDNALEGNIFSNKPAVLERQFERFSQANTILKSRDLGSIICDIKFSELTYLDAFWRDYINGSLLEALKGVFITGQWSSMADARFEPSQWETALLCNDVAHWLGTSLESALGRLHHWALDERGCSSQMSWIDSVGFVGGPERGIYYRSLGQITATGPCWRPWKRIHYMLARQISIKAAPF